MKKLITIFFLYPFFLFAQTNLDTFNIKTTKSKIRKKCKNYNYEYKRVPIEDRYSVNVQGGIILVYMPSELYYNSLFDKKNDGIAVEILKKEQFDCEEGSQHSNSKTSKGYLLPPMYKKELLESRMKYGSNSVVIKYGVLPPEFEPLNIEANLLVIQKKYKCAYHSTTNLDFNNWDILDMGLYRDSLSKESIANKHKFISKTLRFTIPFERNKTKFNVDNIKPLYDSLELEDYNIKEMSIDVYTSVEGTKKRNREIQEGRAKSIVAALQTFQNIDIESHITTNENWVEFLEDIAGTPFQYFENYSKESVKNELKNTTILTELEPILGSHRKAIIELKLQIKFTGEDNGFKNLKSYFDQSISQGNIDEAIYIQNIIFEKIKDRSLPDDFIDKLEIPNELKNGALINNQAIFEYEQEPNNLYSNIINFKRLLELLPKNLKIQYNLTSLKIEAWRRGELFNDREDINSAISELEKSSLNQSLIKRLRVNYYIILTQYYHQGGNYKLKNKILREVHWLYSKLNLNDDDLLSLAKYLANYSKFKWAEELLYKRVKKVDVSEDLMFYYINLTIHNNRIINQSQYRAFLLNAINKNNQRYCDLFLPKAQGGISFQLLENNFLKKVYCENCN